MTLIFLSTAWLIGVAAARYVNPPLALTGLLAVLPLAGFILWRDDPKVRRLAACGLFLLLGSLRYTLSLPDLATPSHIAAYVDRGEVILWGNVANEPDVRDTYTNLYLAVHRVLIRNDERPVKGRILVQVPHYPAYLYGDELKIQGKLETPPFFERFSYRDYLARRGIFGMVGWPEIRLLSQGGGSPIYRALLSLRQQIQDAISAILPEPEASLLTGIVLGVESGIPERVKDAFATSGTMHVVAISGFNISVLTVMMSAATRRWAGRRWVPPLMIVGIWAYALLVGGAPSVTRAAVMGSLYPLARLFGREADVLTGCLLASLIMTLLSPSVLWDLGFQLSFAATLGLIFYAQSFQDAIQLGLSQVLPPGWLDRAVYLIREGLLMTLAAQITTLPLLLHYFGQLSLVSFMANALILPAQPAIMLCGGAAAVAGLLLPSLGRALGWAAWLPLTYTIRMVEWTAGFPGASVAVGAFGSGWVLAWYGALALVTVCLRRERGSLRDWLDQLRMWTPTALLLGALAAAALLVWVAVLSLPDGRLHVTVFDVGQGDAILIATPRGHQILVDGGPSPNVVLDQLGRAMPFWDQTLDLVALTHPDEDHLAGLIAVLERYQVGRVLEPALPCESPLAQEWERTLAEQGLPRTIGRRGMQIALEDGLLIEILHPGPQLLQGTDADDNNNSMVLRLTYGRSTFLLTGDLELAGEQSVLDSEQPVRGQLLKVAHHGAGSGTGDSFLDAVDPQYALISVGRDNRFSHPADEVLDRLGQRGISILRTDQCGQIRVTTDGERFWVRPAQQCMQFG
jgi:competence protein ComEC